MQLAGRRPAAVPPVRVQRPVARLCLTATARGPCTSGQRLWTSPSLPLLSYATAAPEHTASRPRSIDGTRKTLSIEALGPFPGLPIKGGSFRPAETNPRPNGNAWHRSSSHLPPQRDGEMAAIQLHASFLGAHLGRAPGRGQEAGERLDCVARRLSADVGAAARAQHLCRMVRPAPRSRRKSLPRVKDAADVRCTGQILLVPVESNPAGRKLQLSVDKTAGAVSLLALCQHSPLALHPGFVLREALASAFVLYTTARAFAVVGRPLQLPTHPCHGRPNRPAHTPASDGDCGTPRSGWVERGVASESASLFVLHGRVTRVPEGSGRGSRRASTSRAAAASKANCILRGRESPPRAKCHGSLTSARIPPVV
eukprot:365294-Chlamydomonas_euryale.AAC.4